MHSLQSLLYYQMRLIWRVNLWIAPVIALFISVFLYLPDYAHIYWSLKMSENFVPLMGIVICANLFSQEWEGETTELWLVKPTSRTKLLLARTSVAYGYTLFVVIVPLFWQYVTYVQFDWREMLLVVIPPTILLATLGMVIGIIIKRSDVAFLIPLAYWFFEMTTKGDYTGIFHLFSRTAFVQGADPAGALTTFPWVVSKWLTIGAGAGLLAFSAWFLERAGRRSLVRK